MTLDGVFVTLWWTALLVGSIVAVVRMWRSGGVRSYGQASVLPRAWQRWILGEGKRQS